MEHSEETPITTCRQGFDHHHHRHLLLLLREVPFPHLTCLVSQCLQTLSHKVSSMGTPLNPLTPSPFTRRGNDRTILVGVIETRTSQAAPALRPPRPLDQASNGSTSPGHQGGGVLSCRRATRARDIQKIIVSISRYRPLISLQVWPDQRKRSAHVATTALGIARCVEMTKQVTLLTDLGAFSFQDDLHEHEFKQQVSRVSGNEPVSTTNRHEQT